jgi:hypothetical protein
MQMICALLIFQTPDLPAPLGELSPWLDWLITPAERVFALLQAQPHRRFIKTHTPLDGIPLDGRATYIVVGRHPLDMAVSLYYQGSNINRDRLRELTGQPAPAGERPPAPPLHDWLISWVEADVEPAEHLDSLPGVCWHMSDAWARRTSPPKPGSPDEISRVAAKPDVLLVHYDDLGADLDGQMRRLAGLLNITVPGARWPSLVRAATFEHMRASASTQAPDPAGVLKDPAAFFRRGKSGAGHEVLTGDEVERYYDRVAKFAAPAMLNWLHGGSLAVPG